MYCQNIVLQNKTLTICRILILTIPNKTPDEFVKLSNC